jgi:hypothetical protein
VKKPSHPRKILLLQPDSTFYLCASQYVLTSVSHPAHTIPLSKCIFFDWSFFGRSSRLGVALTLALRRPFVRESAWVAPTIYPSYVRSLSKKLFAHPSKSSRCRPRHIIPCKIQHACASVLFAPFCVFLRPYQTSCTPHFRTSSVWTLSRCSRLDAVLTTALFLLTTKYSTKPPHRPRNHAFTLQNAFRCTPIRDPCPLMRSSFFL